MAPKTSVKAILLLSLNLLCYALCTTSSPSLPPPSCAPSSPPLTPPSHAPSSPSPPPPSHAPSSPPLTPPSHAPSSPSPTPPSSGTCPMDALQLGVCANLLDVLDRVVIGKPPTNRCCPLIAGLVDLEAAVCLCTAIKANVLGFNLNIQVALSLILNACGKNPPPGYTCA